jgi:hypothetical protein
MHLCPDELMALSAAAAALPLLGPWLKTRLAALALRLKGSRR